MGFLLLKFLKGFPFKFTPWLVLHVLHFVWDFFINTRASLARAAFPLKLSLIPAIDLLPPCLIIINYWIGLLWVQVFILRPLDLPLLSVLVLGLLVRFQNKISLRIPRASSQVWYLRFCIIFHREKYIRTHSVRENMLEYYTITIYLVPSTTL